MALKDREGGSCTCIFGSNFIVCTNYLVKNFKNIIPFVHKKDISFYVMSCYICDTILRGRKKCEKMSIKLK